VTETLDAAADPGRASAVEVRARYLYAIATARTDLVADLLARRDVVSGVEFLTEERLCAVVGPVPESMAAAASAAGNEGEQQGPQAALDALEAAVRDHEHVVEQVLASTRSMLPIRFGTVLPSHDAVRKLLSQHKAELESLLDALAGRREWGLTVYWEADLAMEAARARVDAPGSADATDSGPGHLFFAAKRAERAMAGAVRDLCRDAARELVDHLQRIGVVKMGRCADREPGGQSICVMDAVVLVGLEDEERFLTAVESALRPKRGLSASLSGPWPPYSFVEDFPLVAQ
jgi:hypothetical protein